MLRSIGSKVRRRIGGWRRRAALWWFLRDKTDAGFIALFAIPILAVGVIVGFAYGQRARAQRATLDAEQQRAMELHCLAENIYFEARGEPIDGQYAVAEVTLNRLTSPGFPRTVCKVVHERRWDWRRARFVAHFSWTDVDTDTLAEPSGPAWQQAMTIAVASYDRVSMPVVPGALYYHAIYVEPYWARKHRIVATIGKHVFYR